MPGQHQQVAPYGSWKSPITADMIAAASIAFGQLQVDGTDLYWIERRAAEKGRNVIVRRTASGVTTDLLSPDFNARTRVHEYGGGDYVVKDGVIYVVNNADQRLYRLVPGSDPVPITPENTKRYANMVLDQRRNRLICVCEDHVDGQREAVNSLVSISLSGPAEDAIRVLVSGNDFYSSPVISPDGTQLAWLTWNHPKMPWDAAELWVGEIDEQGAIRNAEHVAGNSDESICQPEWSPEGTLYFVSDRNDWWNLYRWHNNQVSPVHEMQAEFAHPHWVFGQSMYQFVSEQQIVCAYNQHGISHLATLNTTSGEMTTIPQPYSYINYVQATRDRVFFVGASPTESYTIVQVDLPAGTTRGIRRASETPVDSNYISIPQAIEFPTTGDRSAYAFFYPPSNLDYSAPANEKPPLLVMIHGGPTSATTNKLDLGKQFWTSRGFALLDVNYGGSTGYGRAYRNRLNGQWGVVDVDDCINGAKYLVKQGLVDGDRLAITGGSAGGYTVLCVLTFHDLFKAGASYYGIGDLAQDLDSHKFEARYSFNLVGPYPEQKELYYQRSPLYHVEQLASPVIFFQGLEDTVVLPVQSERMVEALRAKQIPVAYIAFEGEGHGFRQAANIKRALDAELYFYAQIFDFALAEPVEPVHIENLE